MLCSNSDRDLLLQHGDRLLHLLLGHRQILLKLVSTSDGDRLCVQHLAKHNLVITGCVEVADTGLLLIATLPVERSRAIEVLAVQRFPPAADAHPVPSALARRSGAVLPLVPAPGGRGGLHGGFLVGQQAAKRMLAKGEGAILFTGASASVKGYPRSALFAMGKFALRGLVQSMARELAPKNIHVAHFVIDGAILPPGQEQPADNPDSFLDPDAIAQNYLNVLQQHRSTWT